MLKLYTTLLSRLETLREREEGQAMIEYALLASLISVVAVAILDQIGVPLQDTFTEVLNGLT